MTQISTEVQREEWLTFLENNKDASVYHTPGWKRFLEETFNYEAHYLYAKNDSGRIVGLLPLLHVDSFITGSRLCSLPFSHRCGYIGEPAVFEELINSGINLCLSHGIQYFEIRDKVDVSEFKNDNSFSTYILKLNENTQQVWNYLRKANKGSVARAINKSKKAGVHVEVTRDLRDIQEFYKLNCLNKRELGVPCHPWNFFKNLFTYLGDYVSLYAAKYNNRMIAGGVMLYYKDTVLYGYGASDPNYLQMRPNNAYVWKSIEDACKAGFRYYDFGRTSKRDDGLRDFKKRWGTVEYQLYYSYHPGCRRSLSENREGIKYKLLTKLVRRIPMPFYIKLSDVVFKHFG